MEIWRLAADLTIPRRLCVTIVATVSVESVNAIPGKIQMRLCLAIIANVTTFLAIAMMANSALVLITVSVIVANVNALLNGTCLATLLVNAEPPTRPASLPMVSTFINSAPAMANVFVESANASRLKRDNTLADIVKIAQPALESVKNCNLASNACNSNQAP